MDNTVQNNGNRSLLKTRLTSAVCIIMIMFIVFDVSFSQSQMNMPVEFYKEEISMTINNGDFTISGIYYFRNNTEMDKPMPIVFPFYIDDSTHYPHEITAFALNGEEKIKLDYQENKERGSIRIGIPMKPKEITVWRLEYTQKIDKPQATYILKSTEAWGRPLGEALYKIDIPCSIDVDYIWADVDSVTANNNRETLWIHKTEYMPFKDMTIKWKDK
ncbi:MAG: hypothetical protein JSW64_14795 [Candidatus Zixiibacteriota bacterium]|nr:MAG: hypothetical protein JSW64_14795 [candidate division Zixibacteria bacterium]